MTHGSDNKQVRLKFLGEFDDVAHGMTDQNMRAKLQFSLLRRSARAQKHVAETPIGGFFRVSDIGDELRQIRKFFNAHHMEFGLILLRQVYRQRQRAKSSARAVIRLQDFLEQIGLHHH